MRTARPILAILISLLAVALVPPRPGSAHVAVTFVPLSTIDRSVGADAASRAGTSPHTALVWLRDRSDVARASIGRDGHTITVHFRDGARVAILPPQQSTRARLRPLARPRLMAHASPPANGKAIVLEPFATELDEGPDAGDIEANALRQAGFQVDLLRNSQVTIPVMLGLTQYSFVYWNTHAGTLDNGDIVIVTGESNAKPYGKYYDDKTLIQAFVAGDPNKTLYNGITGKFIDTYVGAFPMHSTWFLNGCRGLDGPTFWSDLQSENVDTLISWHEQAQSTQDDRAGQFIMNQLAQGVTVATAVQQAVVEGYGLGTDNGVVAEVGYRGDGSMTLAESLSGVAPTPTATPTGTLTPTATPTETPTPSPTPKPAKLHLRLSITRHQIKAGTRQTVTVQTASYAAVSITVRFPNNTAKKHSGRANARGSLHWSYTEPHGTTRKGNRTVKVTAQVHDAQGAKNRSTKAYTTS